MKQQTDIPHESHGSAVHVGKARKPNSRPYLNCKKTDSHALHGLLVLS